MARILRSINQAVNYWWLLLLTGLMLIFIGIWIMASPEAAYLSLSILFAIGLLVIGIFETAFAITVRRSLAGWGWILASGILDIVIGGYLLANPGVTMAVLPYLLGFWLVLRGFSAVGSALDMRSYGAADWGWLLAMAIGLIFFGFMVIAVPAFGVAGIIIWTSLSFIFAGAFRIFLALRLRRLKANVS